MSSKPLVSAIIIFFNEERFLEEAIESVLAQTYDRWELLLCDDGSTDGSTEIARRYAQQHPGQVRYLEHDGHQNRGMSASRNLGVRHARGKYIAYLDGDDVWLPHKLEEQVAILEAQPEAVMVYGPLHRWYSWNGNPEDLAREDLYGVGKKGVHPYADTLVEPPKLLTLFLREEQFIPSSALVQREAIERVGGGEEVFRGSYEDAAVLVKICLSSAVFVSSQCWYKYRIHPDSWERVAAKLGQANSNRLFYLNWVEEYLTTQGVQNREVWRALRRTLWRARHPRLHRLLNYQRHISETKRVVKMVGRHTLPVACAASSTLAITDKYPPPGGK